MQHFPRWRNKKNLSSLPCVPVVDVPRKIERGPPPYATTWLFLGLFFGGGQFSSMFWPTFPLCFGELNMMSSEQRFWIITLPWTLERSFLDWYTFWPGARPALCLRVADHCLSCYLLVSTTASLFLSQFLAVCVCADITADFHCLSARR